MFSLDSVLEKDTVLLGDLSLCRVLLMNNRLYPWLVLVPRRSDITELDDLISEDRHALMNEITAVLGAMRSIYWPDKMNVASLGNQVPQLHVHIIARFKTDDAWPAPIWGKGSEPYSEIAIRESGSILVRELSKIDHFTDCRKIKDV